MNENQVLLSFVRGISLWVSSAWCSRHPECYCRDIRIGQMNLSSLGWQRFHHKAALSATITLMRFSSLNRQHGHSLYPLVSLFSVSFICFVCRRRPAPHPGVVGGEPLLCGADGHFQARALRLHLQRPEPEPALHRSHPRGHPPPHAAFSGLLRTRHHGQATAHCTLNTHKHTPWPRSGSHAVKKRSPGQRTLRRVGRWLTQGVLLSRPQPCPPIVFGFALP